MQKIIDKYVITVNVFEKFHFFSLQMFVYIDTLLKYVSLLKMSFVMDLRIFKSFPSSHNKKWINSAVSVFNFSYTSHTGNQYLLFSPLNIKKSLRKRIQIEIIISHLQLFDEIILCRCTLWSSNNEDKKFFWIKNFVNKKVFWKWEIKL